MILFSRLVLPTPQPPTCYEPSGNTGDVILLEPSLLTRPRTMLNTPPPVNSFCEDPGEKAGKPMRVPPPCEPPLGPSCRV